jgi:predicted helicase
MARMSVTIHEVLGGLRDTALDKRDQGDKFERLVLSFLKMDPEVGEPVLRRLAVSDWPGRDGRGDAGIDLVAQFRDREGYAAFQCKFYDAETRVSRIDVVPRVVTWALAVCQTGPPSVSE